jgi:hypothetical protein
VGVGDLVQRHDRVHHVVRGTKEWAEAHVDEAHPNGENYDSRVG